MFYKMVHIWSALQQEGLPDGLPEPPKDTKEQITVPLMQFCDGELNILQVCGLFVALLIQSTAHISLPAYLFDYSFGNVLISEYVSKL